MAHDVLIPVADGCDAIEAVTFVDILVRSGAHVALASVEDDRIRMNGGVNLWTDIRLEECVPHNYDMVAIPGGMPGAERLRDCKPLKTILERHVTENRFLAATGASPVVVLQHHGLLRGRAATCHPSFVSHLTNKERIPARLVVDGTCVTAAGAGAALACALTLVEMMCGGAIALQIARDLAMPMSPFSTGRLATGSGRCLEEHTSPSPPSGDTDSM